MISIIVAIADNYAIGKDNKLLCHLSDDLKHFKKITNGHTVIMGKNTFLSIGKPLPNRRNIVISSSMEQDIQGVEVIRSLDDVEPFIEDNNENFIIGGASIYRQMLPKCNKLYITQMHKDFDGDTFFPEIKDTEWKEISREKGPKDPENDFEYDYIEYERIK